MVDRKVFLWIKTSRCSLDISYREYHLHHPHHHPLRQYLFRNMEGSGIWNIGVCGYDDRGHISQLDGFDTRLNVVSAGGRAIGLVYDNKKSGSNRYNVKFKASNQYACYGVDFYFGDEGDDDYILKYVYEDGMFDRNEISWSNSGRNINHIIFKADRAVSYKRNYLSVSEGEILKVAPKEVVKIYLRMLPVD